MRHIEKNISASKQSRMLDMYIRLSKGEIINKFEESERFSVNERSIQRDIDDLRAFILERLPDSDSEIIYDNSVKGYRLYQNNSLNLTNGEALAVAKILLESRGLAKAELSPILDKIIQGCVPREYRREVSDLVADEKLLYVEPGHKKQLVENLWIIGQAVRKQKLMKIKYGKLKGSETVERIIKPVGIMFSEFYFYLTAFIKDIENESALKDADYLFPTIYRIDRIKRFEVLDEHFQVPYKDRFQEGEFRKRIQFMTGGKLRKIKFVYSGLSIEAILDRLPTAQILDEGNGEYTVTAEVFGDGVDMWLRGQGEDVRLLEK